VTTFYKEQMPRKRTKEESDNLSVSDSIAMEQEPIYPTDSEKMALSTFCNVSIQCKRIEKDTQEQLKTAKPKIKELRDKLLNGLKGKGILQIPSNIRKIADSKLSDTRVPAYIRLTKNTKDLTISQSIVKEAFNEIKNDDLSDKNADEIIICVLSAIRRLIRSYNEQAKLTDSLPRGTRAADIEFADTEMSLDAITLFEESLAVSSIESQKRAKLQSVQNELMKRSEEVDRYFCRANMSSQKVNIESVPYNLCKRVTVLKPKVTFGILENFLKEGLSESKSGDFESLERNILSRLGTLQSTTKISIHLKKLGSVSDSED